MKSLYNATVIMQNEYRFRLQKYRHGSKIDCPSCGHRRCFTRYIDTEGIIEFPDYVGRCDREEHCGHHYTPKEYFADNPQAKENISNDFTPQPFSMTHTPKRPMEPPVSHIDTTIMEKSMSHYDVNPLFTYLCSVMGDAEAERLFRLYNVGTSKKWGGSAVFWQVDIKGRVRTGKIICYDPNTGHRIKEPQAYVSWAHSALHLPDFNLRQCLFGEHLLTAHKEQKVMLVESEKTAMIAAYFMPSYLWLATGGKNGCFNNEAMRVLLGRDVTLFPDLGATDQWTAKAEALLGICRTVTVSRLLAQHATDEQREQGLDIADFLLMTETKQMMLAKMIRRNPALQLLIDKLDLHLIED